MSSILQVSSEYFGFKKVLFYRLNETEIMSVNRCNWGNLAANKKRIVRDCLNRIVYNLELINLIRQETSERKIKVSMCTYTCILSCDYY